MPIRLVEFCCDNKISALKYNYQTFQIATEGISFTFEAPLQIASVAAENDDTDIDDSEFSESSSAANTSYTIPSLPKSSKSSLKSLPSTTTLKPVLKRDSSVRSALEFAKEHEDSNIGLLKYFSQGNKEDVDAYWKKEEERTAVNQEKRNFLKKSENMDKKRHERELARIRQQKMRDRIKEKELKEGVRSPGGKKRKVSQDIFTWIKLITKARSLS
jgi:hypothetical protein